MGRIKPTLILGGPGCGKTTALLNIIEQAFSRGVAPERIAFVAFTRKAAQEARERMVEKFDLELKAIPHFRTLHSFAFAQLGMTRNQILSDAKLRDYAKAEGLEISESFTDEFGQTVGQASTEDEKALTAISHAKLTGRELSDVCVDHDLDISYVERVRNDYEDFKEDAILVDFTDMIVKFVAEAEIPQFDLLIVDEAQDLSRAQWMMVARMVENSKDVYFAGDDDQAIYAWAGADVEHFLHMDADREVLPISYRLKREVFEACQKVISLVDERYPKNWEPHADGGEVDYVNNLEDLDLNTGSWYLLARTNRQAQRYMKHLQAMGFAYWSATKDGMKSSVSVDPVRAVLIYENLRQGKSFGGEDLKLVWSFLRPNLVPETAPVFDPLTEYTISDLQSTGFVADASWLDALSISGAMQSYIRALRARGESLKKPPRITCSTIHGVKGGEADNVVIDQKLSSRTFKSWSNADPQEVRALFTAMSRARERLIFLEAKTASSYQVERILSP